MNLPDGLLDGPWTWLAWLLFAALAGLAARRAPWRVLADSTRLNAFLAMIVALILLWHLQAGVKPGLSMHLLGATLLRLVLNVASTRLILTSGAGGLAIDEAQYAAGRVVYAFSEFVTVGSWQVG